MSEFASTDYRSSLYPRPGELWDCDGRLAFVAGNSVNDDGTIWLFDWNTSQVGYRPVATMTACSDRRSLTEEDIVARMTEWTRQGSTDAMWWLAWWFEGKNHPKSVWYYVAAMRANPKKHAWVLDRLYDDARTACMCEGVPTPDLGFLVDIPEMQGGQIGRDWKEALGRAEQAEHVPATKQVDSNIHKVEYFAPSFTPIDR